MRSAISLALGLAAAWLGPAQAQAQPRQERPNIVWIIAEDMSAHFGAYGETTIATPRVDRMAAEGVMFSRAFTTGPVCSASRSALITGMYQTTIGAQNHRSGRGVEKITLPEGVAPVPRLFQQAGYYTCNGNLAGRPGKTDYNFTWDPSIYDGADWSGRAPGQPFFAQIQLNGGKLRHGKNWAQQAEKALGSLTDPADVTLPPYYPRDPVILEDWARYLDTVRYTDMEVGKVLDRLRSEGLLEDTYVFFLTDHGISHARGKQFLYDEGIHIPLVVLGPGLEPGTVREDLVAHIDLAGTSLALAGIAKPASMQAHHLFAEGAWPRDFVVSARDRCDETVDHIRSVRTARFKYIRNFLPDRPYLQPNVYKDRKEILVALRRLHAAGALNSDQALIMAPTRPAEELYDLRADPFELHNLAADPDHAARLAGLRVTLDEWMQTSGDLGRQPEPAAMFDSDMAVYLNEARRNDPPRAAEIEANIRLMKSWAAEGK